jgi:hypothetical protein
MRTALFGITAITMGLGLVACSSDSKPGDELAERGETPEIEELASTYSSEPLEGEFQGDAYQELACYVRLVYCADPRWSPHYPSYCSNGCSVDRRFSASRSLCRDICGNINCNVMYYLGGC